MTLSENQIEKLIECGLTTEQANKVAAKVELLDEDESRDPFKFWANYGKARLYYNSKSNRNRGGFVDLINGTITADSPLARRTREKINAGNIFKQI